MGQKLTGGTLENTPVVGVTRKVGGTFIGVLQDKGREVKMRKGKGNIYAFIIEDVDGFPIEKKDDQTGKYIETEVGVGDKVSMFAPTVLHKALQKANVGDKIKIEYLGKKEGKNSDYHDFDAELI